MYSGSNLWTQNASGLSLCGGGCCAFLAAVLLSQNATRHFAQPGQPETKITIETPHARPRLWLMVISKRRATSLQQKVLAFVMRTILVASAAALRLHLQPQYQARHQSLCKEARPRSSTHMSMAFDSCKGSVQATLLSVLSSTLTDVPYPMVTERNAPRCWLDAGRGSRFGPWVCTMLFCFSSPDACDARW